MWISAQRQRLETLPDDKKEKLLSIGFVQSVKKNKEEIKNIFIQYGIDTRKNKTILDHISIQELQSKIQFLESHNIPIIGENGKLTDIFSMSSFDMEKNMVFLLKM